LVVIFPLGLKPLIATLRNGAAERATEKIGEDANCRPQALKRSEFSKAQRHE
jgi:hypothetical protein